MTPVLVAAVVSTRRPASPRDETFIDGGKLDDLRTESTWTSPKVLL